MVTPEHKYVRAPAGDNAPLSMLSNRWSTMPTHAVGHHVTMPPPDDRAFLDRMPGSRIPVIHQPYDVGDPKPFWASRHFSGNHVYDRHADPDELENLAGSALESELSRILYSELSALHVPASQFDRLGLD